MNTSILDLKESIDLAQFLMSSDKTDLYKNIKKRKEGREGGKKEGKKEGRKAGSQKIIYAFIFSKQFCQGILFVFLSPHCLCTYAFGSIKEVHVFNTLLASYCIYLIIYVTI